MELLPGITQAILGYPKTTMFFYFGSSYRYTYPGAKTMHHLVGRLFTVFSLAFLSVGWAETNNSDDTRLLISETIEYLPAHLGTKYFMKAPRYGGGIQLFRVNGVYAGYSCNRRFGGDIRRPEQLIGHSWGFPNRASDEYQDGFYYPFDSKKYRQVIEEPCDYSFSFKVTNKTHTFRYCPRLSSSTYDDCESCIRRVGSTRYGSSCNGLNLPYTVVCLGEGPILADLVVNTETDGLGDHDCGYYGETESARREYHQQLSRFDPNLAYSGQPRGLDIHLQFLVGGHTYTRLYFNVSSSQILLFNPLTTKVLKKLA